ncbi:glycine betaine ABC transporter substrate-binding protein OsmF [Ancylobacter rudongensis]|uniref:Osmoprotectant transport system substrate-binding protein n=1 Tax=Ancylobacter rudongensis TaxID=177413 RepID=A0A1G4RRK5_9HYPH|nr:ABC transporter substrate-binding protein [Ancylobacter rudongensis]SCW59468.1 osmoprotectant transport system substrate-binding protein [Ancylobacter rudongensis]
MVASINRRRLLGSIAAAALVPAALAHAAAPVVVSSKIDTEGAVLGNIVALVLEHAGIPVTRRLQLGPTKIVRTALLAGEIDLYPEYTGNAGFFFAMADDPVWKNAGAAYEKARDLDAANGLVWLAPAPADNTWGIAVRGDVASAEKLATLEDFARWTKAGDVKLAASAEFVESAAALPAFQSAYGFTLSGGQLLVLSGGDTAATIKAAAEGTSGVNAAMVYGTDGAIAALNLKVMADTKQVQPVYQPAPVIRKAVLDAYPQIAALLAPAFAGLTLPVLQQLNAQVQLEGLDARSVAEAYLKAQGLLG